MQTLTYLISFIALAVLARAFFSWNNTNEQIVPADTTEVVIEESVILNEVKDLNNYQDSSAMPQNDSISWITDDTPPLTINEITPPQSNNNSAPVLDSASVSGLPSSINHPVTFFPQAPDGNRNLPRQEACEEASITLANYFIKGKPLSKDQMRADILALVDRQMELFGDYLHTTVEQTKQLYEDFYGWGSYIIDNPTIEQIKSILAQWQIIVAPFAGRKLGNPYYSGPWPLYHMMVIRWYDDTYFYTNDVGTRRGENFTYTHAVIMDALHDRNEANINQWAKKILVITK